MKKPLLFILILLFLTCNSIAIQSAEQDYDLVIYGGTSAAVSAAVQAKREGLSVIIVSPAKHLGGMSSSGLGWTDSGTKGVIGGISSEFYRRIGKKYGKTKSGWKFEPHVAEEVFEDFVKEYEIPVIRDEWLDRGKGVEKKDGKIVSITTLSGKKYRGKVFIDATYEGDLLAAAGVSYTVGREANTKYGETINGVQFRLKHQFVGPAAKVSAFKVPGDPSSGLLPRISAEHPGKPGSADKKVQAYTYRLCMTPNPENRVPFTKPEGYDPAQYELLLRLLKVSDKKVYKRGTFVNIYNLGKFSPLPNKKTDTNNYGAFSTDNIGMSWEYPEASYEKRQKILNEHKRYQMGFYYFLQNDPRVPAEAQEWIRQWGLAKDEFQDNDNWPYQIYIREARRMVGDFVMTQNHVQKKLPTSRPIGMGSYTMDSHNVQRYVTKDGFVRNEGDIQSRTSPYPIDYGVLLPKKSECSNLLVPVCGSTTHIAYGTVRMEPVFLLLGQSAATAAAVSIEDNVAVQDVPYEKLSKELVQGGQVLKYSKTKKTFSKRSRSQKVLNPR